MTAASPCPAHLPSSCLSPVKAQCRRDRDASLPISVIYFPHSQLTVLRPGPEQPSSARLRAGLWLSCPHHRVPNSQHRPGSPGPMQKFPDCRVLSTLLRPPTSSAASRGSGAGSQLHPTASEIEAQGGSVTTPGLLPQWRQGQSQGRLGWLRPGQRRPLLLQPRPGGLSRRTAGIAEAARAWKIVSFPPCGEEKVVFLERKGSGKRDPPKCS